VSKRNFITLPLNSESQLERYNSANVKVEYSAAQIELTTDHLAKSMKAVWENVRDITGQAGIGGSSLQNSTDATLR